MVPNSDAMESGLLQLPFKWNNSKTVKNQKCSANYGCIKGQLPHTALYIIIELEMQRYQAWHKRCSVTYILNTCLMKRF